MYTTSKTWERVIYVTTWLVQGSSFLVPRAYGVMHRMHHTYSDTEQDPHSPHFFKDVFGMMWHTINIFEKFKSGSSIPYPEFTKEYLPAWNSIDRLGDNMLTRILFGAAYTIFYIFFAPSLWWFLLLPIHFLMGPVQGAVVNWCGHKYGYRNYESEDHSKNTSPFGVLLMGELFQNNHHHQSNNANFARRWFEFDLTYIIMLGLNKMRIIKLISYPKAQNQH